MCSRYYQVGNALAPLRPHCVDNTMFDGRAVDVMNIGPRHCPSHLSGNFSAQVSRLPSVCIMLIVWQMRPTVVNRSSFVFLLFLAKIAYCIVVLFGTVYKCASAMAFSRTLSMISNSNSLVTCLLVINELFSTLLL